MKDTKEEDPLVVILRSVKALDEDKIQQAVKESSVMGMSLESTLAIKGELAKTTLNLFAEAAASVRSGDITLDMAIRAVRLSNIESISLDEAMGKLKKVHKATVTVSSIANELMQIMLDANIINSQQMSYAVVNGESSGMLPGRVLLLNKAVSNRGLEASISACLLMRQKVIEKENVLEALKRSQKKNCCLEQALFELGTFKQPTSYNMRLSDLLVMSGLINESDLLECRELSIYKNKSFKQIVLEQGLVDSNVMHFVNPLQSLVASGNLKPFEAGLALSKVCKQNMALNVAADEAKTASLISNSGEMLIGQLLVQSGCLNQAQMDEVTSDRQSSNIKIGKMLLAAGFINEDVLIKSLRVQSAWKHGYIARQEAVQLLSRAVRNMENLEVHAKQANIYVPAHVQWSWV